MGGVICVYVCMCVHMGGHVCVPRADVMFSLTCLHLAIELRPFMHMELTASGILSGQPAPGISMSTSCALGLLGAFRF